MADDYRNAVYQLDVALQTVSAIKISPFDRPIGVEYDFVDDRIYWTDFESSVVKSAYLNGSELQIIKPAELGLLKDFSCVRSLVGHASYDLWVESGDEIGDEEGLNALELGLHKTLAIASDPDFYKFLPTHCERNLQTYFLLIIFFCCEIAMLFSMYTVVLSLMFAAVWCIYKAWC